MGEGQRDGVGAVLAPAVVLATGGLGPGVRPDHQSRPSPPATGWPWPCAPARRWPTWSSCSSTRPCCGSGPTAHAASSPWCSEAVRGEGAVLRDDDGERFMQRSHPLADLAPRDVVAKAIMRRMRETGPRTCGSTRARSGGHVGTRFPTILESLPASTASTRSPTSSRWPGPALRLRRGAHRPRTAARSVPGLYAVRRGRVHRRARRQPAGLQLAARGPRVRRADRLRAGRGPARPPGPGRVARARRGLLAAAARARCSGP